MERHFTDFRVKDNVVNAGLLRRQLEGPEGEKRKREGEEFPAKNRSEVTSCFFFLSRPQALFHGFVIRP